MINDFDQYKHVKIIIPALDKAITLNTFPVRYPLLFTLHCPVLVDSLPLLFEYHFHMISVFLFQMCSCWWIYHFAPVTHQLYLLEFISFIVFFVLIYYLLSTLFFVVKFKTSFQDF
jgi:hypothetical protein